MSNALKGFLAVIALVVVVVLGFVLGWFGEATEVAQEEFGARPSLEKYEWFIDRASAIEKMDEDIANFSRRVENINEQYSAYGEKVSWPPDIRMQYNHDYGQARDDLVAIVSQRNGLVQEYNAQSEKFNWAPFKTRLDKPRESFEELDLP